MTETYADSAVQHQQFVDADMRRSAEGVLPPERAEIAGDGEGLVVRQRRAAQRDGDGRALVAALDALPQGPDILPQPGDIAVEIIDRAVQTGDPAGQTGDVGRAERRGRQIPGGVGGDEIGWPGLRGQDSPPR